jgi:hypothetical protein
MKISVEHTITLPSFLNLCKVKTKVQDLQKNTTPFANNLHQRRVTIKIKNITFI